MLLVTARQRWSYERSNEMNFSEQEKRYLSDPLFHRIVEMLYHFLQQGQVTVSELRDAATFAGIKFEEQRVRPIFLKDGFQYQTEK